MLFSGEFQGRPFMNLFTLDSLSLCFAELISAAVAKYGNIFHITVARQQNSFVKKENTL